MSTSMIARTSERLDETGEMVLRGINVMFLVAVLVAVACAVVLMVAATFGILHPGNDFDFRGFGGSRGDAGDVIVQPVHLF